MDVQSNLRYQGLLTINGYIVKYHEELEKGIRLAELYQRV